MIIPLHYKIENTPINLKIRHVLTGKEYPNVDSTSIEVIDNGTHIRVNVPDFHDMSGGMYEYEINGIDTGFIMNDFHVMKDEPGDYRPDRNDMVYEAINTLVKERS